MTKPKWGGFGEWQWSESKCPPGAARYAFALLLPAIMLGVNVGTRSDSVWFFLQSVAVLGTLAFGGPYLWFRWSRRTAAEDLRRKLGAGAAFEDADWTRPRDGAAGRFFAPTPMFVMCVGVIAAYAADHLLRARDTAFGTARDLIVGGFLVLFVLFIATCLWAGRAQVTFVRFPYRVGEPVRLFVGMMPGSAQVTQARYLLRCAGFVSDARRKRPSIRWQVHWKAEGVPATDRVPGPDEFVELTFEPPAGLPGTSLHGVMHTRWEIEVQCRSRWGAVSDTFLVPVYAPGPPSAPEP